MGLGTAAVASFEDVVAGSLLVRSVASLASGINAKDENVADAKTKLEAKCISWCTTAPAAPKEKKQPKKSPAKDIEEGSPPAPDVQKMEGFAAKDIKEGSPPAPAPAEVGP